MKRVLKLVIVITLELGDLAARIYQTGVIYNQTVCLRAVPRVQALYRRVVAVVRNCMKIDVILGGDREFQPILTRFSFDDFGYGQVGDFLCLGRQLVLL